MLLRHLQNPRMLPAGPVEVNRSHRLGQGVVSRIIPSSVMGWTDFGGRQVPMLAPSTGANAPTFVGTQMGPLMNLNGTAGVVTGSDAGLPSGAADRSISVWFQTSTTTGVKAIFSYGTAGGASYLLGYVNGTSVTVGNTANYWSPAGTTWADGKLHHLVVSAASNVWSGAIDGVATTGSTATATTTLSGATGLRLGNYLTNIDWFPGIVDNFTVWNRALTADEKLQLYLEPFVDLRPARRQAWIYLASAGGATAAALQADLSAAASVGADLSTAITMAASPAAASAVSASLTTSISLSTSLAASSTVAASLTTAITPAATIGAASTVFADLSTQITLGAAPAASSTVAVDLSTAIRLSAALTSTATLSATMAGTSAALAAALQGASTVAASLTTAIPLAAATAASSTVTAALTTAIPLTASLLGSTALTASLAGNAAALSTGLGASSSVSATLTTAITLGAAFQARTVAIADLTTSIRMFAALIANSQITAALTTVVVAPTTFDVGHFAVIPGDARFAIIPADSRFVTLRGA